MVKTMAMVTFAFMLLASTRVSNGQGEKAGMSIPDYSQLERGQVPAEFTWKIEDIYPNLEAWKADKAAVEPRIAGIEEKARGWTETPQRMLALLKWLEEINIKGGRLFAYASHQYDVDMGNQLFQSMRGELQTIFVQLNSRLAFFNADVLALGAEKFAAYLKNEPGLAPYRFQIEEVLRSRDHVLPSDQQRIVSLTGLFSGTSGRAAGMLNDVEAPPVEVTLSDGGKVKLNFPNFLRLRSSANASDRSRVMRSFWENQKMFANTLAILQDGAVKQHLFDAQVHHFKDSLETRLFDDNIPVEVYRQLVRMVRENLATMHRYLELKRRLMKLKTYRYDDIYASAVAAVDRLFTTDQARKMIMDSLKPLGREYTDALKLAFANRWMDLYPNKGKESGAYSGGLYGVHPFIKLNYNGKYNAVSTMAHELGHALHSYFAEKSQPYATSGYATFMAEVASTFNENMLMQHLLKTEKDDLFKLFVLDSYLDQVRGTLFRQTLFAEFELAMHQQVEQGKTLTAEWLNRTYLDLTREYYGHNKGVCEVGDYIQVEWSRIPHFYMNYYVFQYSTGLIASMALSDMVLGDPRRGPQQYLGALKAGGSDHPIAILKKAGVDMNDTAPYQAAFRRVNLMLDEMEKIVLRLQKTK